METVEVMIKLPKEIINHVNKFGTIFYNEYISYIADELRTATVLPANHGKIVDLGKIDEDKIDKDNPIIYLIVNGEYIEAVSLDYLDNLPDLTKKEDKK